MKCADVLLRSNMRGYVFLTVCVALGKIPCKGKGRGQVASGELITFKDSFIAEVASGECITNNVRGQASSYQPRVFIKFY